MKRILLYQNIKTGTINTLSEKRSQYEIENNCDLPITDDTMESILRDQLWSVGGNLLIISCSDPILKWVHEYAEAMEAERYLSAFEIASSIRDIYVGINGNDNIIIESLKANLDSEDELLDRLNKLLKEVK